MDLTPDSVPDDVRKCPIHNAWIKAYTVKKVRTRYCPTCFTLKQNEQAKVFKEAGTLPPNVRIGKI